MIGNLTLIADVDNRSHSINMLMLFFMVIIEVRIINMAIIHINMLLYFEI